ncbi:hypothetical protein, partial [Micromonospora sp. NPDC005313]|uniref:hypothetical protein n=1 Tax=Micromonospora sp. NPDC005313 TaxID=3154296 RepID=UPI0033B6C929
ARPAGRRAAVSGTVVITLPLSSAKNRGVTRAPAHGETTGEGGPIARRPGRVVWLNVPDLRRCETSRTCDSSRPGLPVDPAGAAGHRLIGRAIDECLARRTGDPA